MAKGTLFLTGGTGFLGSHIAAELIRRKYRVILAIRSRWGKNPSARVRSLLNWLEIEPEGLLEVVEAQIEQPYLGLHRNQLRAIGSRIDGVFHCAADTSFAARKESMADRVNITGLRYVFEALGNCRHFYHMSTAYVAGKKEGICGEEIEPEGFFNNPYEKSKYQAEKEITRLCTGAGIPLTVFRPSIVYGDSISGRSLRFNALYYPVRMVISLRDAFLRDIQNREGSRAQKMGVSLDSDNRLNMPIRIPDQGGGLDLIPIDHLTRAVMAIMDEGHEGIFHLINPVKKSLSDLIGYIQTYSRVSGIVPVAGGRGGAAEPLEMLIDELMSLYDPYLCDRRVFDDSRTRPILKGAGLVCPDLDYDSFSRCMDYAIQNRWGATLRI